MRRRGCERPTASSSAADRLERHVPGLAVVLHGRPRHAFAAGTLGSEWLFYLASGAQLRGLGKNREARENRKDEDANSIESVFSLL